MKNPFILCTVRRILWGFSVLLFFSPFLLYAQPKLNTKKYPSLLWEISGNGLSKPSWLFGTMHVSSKLAFHLADSFFLCIRNADVVALETNPESWQEEMSKYDLNGGNSENYNNTYRPDALQEPNDYLSINTLRFFKYDKKIERALYSSPSAINNLLYRSYGNEASDFEEDTYLDMYIYQCGKKWGKIVAGVERYDESMKLMMEAYKDAAKDRYVKERSNDNEDSYSFNKLQEAYRSGNLDWLDSINKYNSFSAAFDEKFLYRRNEIQAYSIDSILKSGQSLFVGVGAAHLPGGRGVIEMLRKHGYKLRPVKMGARDSQHKSQVEKVRVAVNFATQIADDGMYKVDIPGKFYPQTASENFGEQAGLELDQRQYADMANGSYYMVTRIMTNAWMWGHSTAMVGRIIDSLLYENIPGKIIAKSKIIRNGYPGIDLTNKTRRGDVQRYNIFITPFEVIIFKMGGTGDYVRNGVEAKKFFGSIGLKENKQVYPLNKGWKKFSPLYGGFSVDMPHVPFVGNDGSWIFDAEDKTSHTNYRIIRSDIHNYQFAEEDSFDLELMAESFESSEFIDKIESRKLITIKGYPALDCRYRHKSGAVFLTRFIIQGPHYYTLVAYGKKELVAMNRFLNSFEIKRYNYPASKQRQDTSLYYSVSCPVLAEARKEKFDIPRFNYPAGDEDDEIENGSLENGLFRTKVIANDTTGEKIFVSFYKLPRYGYTMDSIMLYNENQNPLFQDSSGIIKLKKESELPGGMKVWESIITDTGSSRTIWNKRFYKNGIGYTITTQSDTLSKPSVFVQSFFDSFVPADSLQGMDPFSKKSDLFFADFMSSDSVAHRRAVKNIYAIKLDSTDLPQLKTAISFLDWKEKKYLDTKKALIAKLDEIPTKKSSDYLKDLYYAAGDTIELQYSLLEVLLQQKTQYAFNLFRDIMINEPPVLDMTPGRTAPFLSSDMKSLEKMYSYENGNFMEELQDSLKLTRTILTDLLPLLNLEDYKSSMMDLLAGMVDSSLVNQTDYDVYFSKFLLEAKHELKKQTIAEKQKAIEKAERGKEDKKNAGSQYGKESENEYNSGNQKLRLYTTLLIPFWETRPAVQSFFNQIFLSADDRLKYYTMMLLLQNNKKYPDSLVKYFAGMDDYRYELFTSLKAINREKGFPARYNNHIDLAKSKLLSEKIYDKPDSLLYVDRLIAEVKGKKGFVYFFKYKAKKDDASWKIATIGLVPESPTQFEFDKEETKAPGYSLMYNKYPGSFNNNFNGFSDTKIRDEEPVIDQFQKELKRMIYSRRKSAKEFYDKAYRESNYAGFTPDFEED